MDKTLSYRVTTALGGSPYFNGTAFHLETDSGRVILHGTVPSYFQKQMAQEILRNVDGIIEIENMLHVKQDTGNYTQSLS